MSKIQTLTKGVEVNLSSETFYSNTAPKRLTVELDFETPRYTFEGSWTGKDIRLLTNQLRRAYVGYRQNLIRQANNSTTTEKE